MKAFIIIIVASSVGFGAIAYSKKAVVKDHDKICAQKNMSKKNRAAHKCDVLAKKK